MEDTVRATARLAVLAILLAACDGSDDGGLPTPSPSPATSTATATAPDTPTPTAVPSTLHGRVVDAAGAALSGVMITAYDDADAASVSVFTGVDGRYDFPPLAAGTYRVRARRSGWDTASAAAVAVTASGGVADFALQPAGDPNAQLPPIYFKSLLEWPNARVEGDFSRACANCHQIGDFRWRGGRTREEWQAVVDRMIGYGGVPFLQETRDVLVDTLAHTFGPQSPAPRFSAPPPPSGEVLRAVISEWEIDPVARPDCHDLELGLDGTVYTVGGVWTLNPRTGERASFPIEDGGHSIERDGNGDMWITAPGPEQLIKLDVTTKQFTAFDHPRIGDDLGSYPHTLAFDRMGRIWYTLTRSNHVGRFDPDTETFTYYRLPPADPAISGVPIAAAYGCDVAPDQSVWWSQLFGHHIGRVDPTSGTVSAWQPPFDGPRRLFVGPDNIVWVPGYGSAELGRFDPATESWKVYALPTEPAGHELPYDVAVDRRSGEVWITGSNSDTLIRFRPDTETFTVFPLPTATDFTREIEFDDEGGVWTCTSAQPIDPETPGSGRIIRLQIRPREGACGDGAIQLGEACDDGNTADCDGCSALCALESGCGDGARCAEEACDDGNRRACDGCSPACALEPGAACGDGTVNAACGEQCDPPGAQCTAQCQRLPVCGDGFTGGAEACDDGNTADCDGCSAACVVETDCGDGVRCGAEACDDGNALACDGCSPACVTEVGAACGDGVVNPGCGEECDPPGAGCSLICTTGDGVLGTRRLSFGGSFYSSALGVAVPLGTLQGALDLTGGAIDASGVAPVDVVGPVLFSAAILGGQYGTLCARIDGCTGFVDCDGGTAVDTVMVQDSNGAGANGLPVTITTGVGSDAAPGAMLLDCQQAYVQLGPGEGTDCAAVALPPAERIVYTTGSAEAFYLNGRPKVGNGAIRISGEPFSCAAWQTTDGPGQLAGTFVVEEDPRAGDLANVIVIDD
jgi:cysteine-rich repeat protein